MRLGSTTLVAFRALRRNKMRSILTALGIIIGVAAVIAMVSIGNGAKAMVQNQIASLGQNMLLIFPGSTNAGGVRTGWGNRHTLTLADAQAILAQIREVDAVSPENNSHNQVAFGNQNWFTRIAGESPDYFKIREWPIVEGESFNDQQVRSIAKVCVIGQTIVTQLFPSEDPIGKVIRIGSVPCQVIGVLAPKGLSPTGFDQDDLIVVPYTTETERVHHESWADVILAQAVSTDALPVAQEEIAGLLRQRHHIADTSGQSDDFTIRSQEDIANAATATTSTMTYLLGGIAGVSLVVGGIGIMNIMLVSVTERTREIGIRMAVGAHGRDILAQFLIEAVVLSLIGGGIGVLLGVGTAQAVSQVKHWPTLVSTSSVVIALLFSGAVGIFFGFYPARKAANLDPIDALRYE